MIISKKYNLIIIACLLLVFSASSVKAEDPALVKQRMIDILGHEIKVLNILLKNMVSAQSQSYSINAKSYIVLDIESQKVLLEKNIDDRQSIASITKLMNATIAEENVKKDQTITIKKEMLGSYGYSPSIYEGLNINFDNLLKASLIQSVNDAAQSISYFVGKDKFVDLMNKKAKDLSMNSTTYVDSNGMNPENKSTARDLSKLVSFIYNQHPDILETTRDNNFWLKDQKGRLLKFSNLNFFYYLPEFIGGKTGYLEEARENIASVFNVNGKPIAIITLNSDNQQADTLAILNQLEK